MEFILSMFTEVLSNDIPSQQLHKMLLQMPSIFSKIDFAVADYVPTCQRNALNDDKLVPQLT